MTAALRTASHLQRNVKVETRLTSTQARVPIATSSERTVAMSATPMAGRFEGIKLF